VARIRTIKPEFPQSESMGRVSRDARLLFVMLWPICDDHGRTRAASRMLASLLFPYDDDAPSLIDGWLDELEREGCIRRYVVDGSTFLEVCNWLFHQKIDKPSRPQFPSFDEGSPRPREDSRMFVVGREGKGREWKGEDHPRAGEEPNRSAPEANDDDLGLKLPKVTPPVAPTLEGHAGDASAPQGAAEGKGGAEAEPYPWAPLLRALVQTGRTGNSTWPEFAQAVALGVKPEDLTGLADEFPDKPARYLLKAAITRATPAAVVPGVSPQGARPSRQQAVETQNLAVAEQVKARIRAEAQENQTHEA
jgi:hypothetical protein